jgi:Ca2+-transporting ATPase
MKQLNWHAETIDACLNELNVTEEGLSLNESEKRLMTFGHNTIRLSNETSILRKWANQFNNVLIYILIMTAILTGFFQQFVDSFVILIVVLINAFIGYIQESKAEKAIEALRKMLPLKANAIREGQRMKMDADLLVPGDIVCLQPGDKVPADLRLIRTNNLQIDESILTGESWPVDKNEHPDLATESLMKRKSIAYSGTLTTFGMGIGVVIATGSNTEIGRISAMLKGTSYYSTPLLRQLAKFGHTLAVIILFFSLLIIPFGIIIRHYPTQEMLLAAVAIAVSVIPEGLPAIITIALAIGVTRMSKRNAIIRRLSSVETLSSVTVICTDKTGTLTKNELTVQKIVLAKRHYNVTGSGYNDDGIIERDKSPIRMEDDSDLSLLIRTGLLCNEAELTCMDGKWILVGSPMDGALLALALKAKLNYQNAKDHYPRKDSIPFDSRHKFMASLHHDQQEQGYIFVKGAPEKLLSMCSFELQNGILNTLDKSFWHSQIDELAADGMRVLALAFRQLPSTPADFKMADMKKGLVLIGIVGIIDPPREEAKEAISACQQAGIRIKMVTGDHRLTAQAIAQQIGIPTTCIITGKDIDEMSDAELADAVEKIDIFARTIPEHKIRLIKALQTNNHVVAMTGDGVNDAPALKNADIGIAMGIKGTDVAKESSEIVLADDNFSSIKEAVEEGRNVYNNLKKALLFILPNDGSEGLVIFLAILFGYTLPITPVQILWVNLVTTVTLALALAFEKPDKNIMMQEPRNPDEPLLSFFLIWRICFVSLVYVCCMFGLFIYEINQGIHIEIARTLMVNVLVFLEVGYLINCRRIYDSVLSIEGLFGSKPALIAIGLVIVLQLAFTYLPIMQYLFKTQPLNMAQWGVSFVLVLVVFFIIELEKMMARNYLK